MKRCLVILAVFLFFARVVSAHRFGIPIVKLNDVWAPSNPIVNFISNTSFTVPADLAPATYLAGVPITFGMNDAFQRAADGSNIQFKWDFGDNTSFGTGLSSTHIYQKPGSYIVTVSFRYPNENNYYPSDNILVQVLPTKETSLPRAEIKVNGKAIPNTQMKAVPFAFHEPVEFDASESHGDLVSFQWDFGDGKSGSGKKVVHTYVKTDTPTFFAILRVTDSNNISSDSAVFLTEGDPVRKTASSLNFFQQILSFFMNLFKKK